MTSSSAENTATGMLWKRATTAAVIGASSTGTNAPVPMAAAGAVSEPTPMTQGRQRSRDRPHHRRQVPDRDTEQGRPFGVLGQGADGDPGAGVAQETDHADHGEDQQLDVEHFGEAVGRC